ncbi:MAG: PKD domain-containing protein [Ferruginibacter sp.]
MKLTALLLIAFLATAPAYSQIAGSCPANIDFELGDFSNWQCYTGSTDTANGQNVINLIPSPPTPNRHELIAAGSFPLNDPYGNFPRVCPNGGNYSVKLGNNSTGKQAEGLSYIFTVPVGVDTFSITYYYAVVFENPGHTRIEQPRFFVTAFDAATGALINCASYDYVATGSIPGFQSSSSNPDVLYKGWTPVSLSFTGLAGRSVELEFKTADCTRGGHFGYAYVDVGSGCSSTIATAAYCVGSNAVTLNAPFGFQSYIWYNQDYSQVVGNQQIVTLTPPPAVNTIFHVDMIPYPGYGCRDTADGIVKLLPIPDTPVAQSSYSYCQGASVNPLTATAVSGNSLYWYNSASGGLPANSPPIPSTTVPGIFHYYVSQKELFGCESPRKEIIVTVLATPDANFTVNNIKQCQTGNHFIFTSSVISPNTGYEWDFGDGQTSTLAVADHVYSAYGNLNVKLRTLNPPSCYNQKTQTVIVVPSPVADFIYPAVICDQQTAVILSDNSTVPGSISTINKWYWNINGALQTVQNPVSFFAAAGPLPVKLAVQTVEGCRSDTHTVVLGVHYLPNVKFSYSKPLCENETIRFTDLSNMPAAAAGESVVKWNWKFDNGTTSSLQNPGVGFTTGTFHAKLIAESNLGCRSKEADSVFNIYAKPHIGLYITDSCVNRVLQYSAIDVSGTVAGWYWNFGTGLYQNPPVITRSYTSPGSRPFNLIGMTVNGCKDSIVRAFTIYNLNIFAGNDTVTAMNEPVQLFAVPSTTVAQYNWTPALGLNNAFIQNPVATYDHDQLYNLKAFSDKGCDASSKVLVRRYKGPELYIPNAFSPNGDGLNDVLKVFPVGIKSFISFSVYNRGGQLIFSSSDYSIGWDGTFKGARSDLGNYVVMAKAIDYRGREMFVKQNVLLLH